jgi:hypothetical protein
MGHPALVVRLAKGKNNGTATTTAKATADPSLTTPELKNARGPVRSG